MSGTYRNPVPTVDLIIRDQFRRVVLIKRRNPPFGWALPGGFVDYGEDLESAALREALEETSLHVDLERQFHTYSSPGRDPRKHTITTVFLATVTGGQLRAADDAAEALFFTRKEIREAVLAFDHAEILSDYFANRY
jgi:ADP-ribose pyrophosphatase YjhB (NUDIX family)